MAYWWVALSCEMIGLPVLTGTSFSFLLASDSGTAVYVEEMLLEHRLRRHVEDADVDRPGALVLVVGLPLLRGLEERLGAQRPDVLVLAVLLIEHPRHFGVAFHLVGLAHAAPVFGF